MRFNMLTFLGFSLVLVAASGYKKVDIQVALEDSILLTCPCLKRDMARDVSWQTKTKNILSYKANITNLNDEYKDRSEIFLTKDSNNCSLLLTNITKYDQGVYKCNYYNPLYNYTEFNLTVVGESALTHSLTHSVLCMQPNPTVNPILPSPVSYTVCQRVLSVMKGTSERTFQCDVKGRSPGALIHWTLYGERLPTPTISFQNVSNGLYHLSSHLTIELNGTSEPLCVVEHTHHTQLYLTNSTCIVDGKEERKIRKQTSESVIAISSSVVVVIIIIVLFLLALYLVLYRPRAKRDTEKRIRERRGESEENGLTLIEQSASDHINSDGLIQSTV